MSASTDDILAALDEMLSPERFADYCHNGLQVPGPSQIATLATGVSAHVELFELAGAEGADLLIVHHGLLWGSGVDHVDERLKRRLSVLFDGDIALAAYHLPLDAHPDVGNNALLARGLGVGEHEPLEPFARHGGETIGFIASFPGAGLAAEELFARVHALTAREPLVFETGPAQVRRLAIVSGGGGDYITEAAEAAADALLTGEVSERSMADARELGVHLIAAGHYATETFGVRRIGELMAERFGLRHVFLDVPNPI